MLAVFLRITGGNFFHYLTAQKIAYSKSTSRSPDQSGDANSAPFDNAAEEKTGNGTNAFGFEYLQPVAENLSHALLPLKHHKTHQANSCLLFIGEFVTEPPEIPAGC
jgi:hypothetical protein